MNKKTEFLQYCQKNAKEAFSRGYTIKMHHNVIDSEVYEVHKYYLPQHAVKKIRWVRKYFEFLDEQELDIAFKRRKHWVEYAETSMLMLSRIWSLCGKGHIIVAGSEHVSPIPWAIFGESQGRMTRNHFTNVLEIADHYRNYLHGQCYPIDINFRMGAGWAPKIASTYKKQPFCSSNFWMAVGLCITHDIIQNCGPDCNEFFELFTNDNREQPGEFDILSWGKLRCKILSVSGKRPVLPIAYTQTCFKPIKTHKVKTEIALIFEGKDLVTGENTRPVKTSTYPLMLPYRESCNTVHLFGINGHSRFGGSPDML